MANYFVHRFKTGGGTAFFSTPEVTSGVLYGRMGLRIRAMRSVAPPTPPPPPPNLLPVSMSPVGSIHVVVNTVPWMG